MATSILFQQILHVFKELHVAALVTGNCNSLYIFLNSGFHYLLYRPVMAQVNDLHSFALKDPAHDINSSIMPVKKRGSCYDPDFRAIGIRHKLPSTVTKIIKRIRGKQLLVHISSFMATFGLLFLPDAGIDRLYKTVI